MLYSICSDYFSQKAKSGVPDEEVVENYCDDRNLMLVMWNSQKITKIEKLKIKYCT